MSTEPNTMMDAHDKNFEQHSSFKNTIEIDYAGIPTTDFKLNDKDKELLFKNGYYAASEFLLRNEETLNISKNESIVVHSPATESYIINKPHALQSQELIRVSISSLFKIVVDGKYLLVKGNRINQFQPVGGVFKRLNNSSLYLSEMGILDDDKLPIDAKSRDDLRVRVPMGSLSKFLEWFRSGR